MLVKKKGQVWVETAIYSLIGLTIIAILLSIVTPQVEKAKDREIIKQTIEALNILDSKVSEVEQTSGNVRFVNLRIAKGKLIIDSIGDSIIYNLEDTRLEYSELNEEIRQGNLIVKTGEYGRRFNITLTRKYEGLNLIYGGEDKNKILQAGSTPYRLQVESKEDPDIINNKMIIDFNVH